uniref:Uncharacterized protein n=1 Tax=Oryza meridionalis TaxID=40149 RepID=A0A0E0CXQ4_9ORYZ
MGLTLSKRGRCTVHDALLPRYPNPMPDPHSVFLFIRSCMPQTRRLRFFLLSDPDNWSVPVKAPSPRASAPITRVVTALAHY